MHRLVNEWARSFWQVRRLVAAALKDIITPDDLYEGVKMTLGRNTASFLKASLGGRLEISIEL